MMAEIQTVSFTQITGRPNQQMQIPVKADLIVPDSKPDIGRILKTKVYLDMGEKTLDNSRLHWGGKLVCQMLYAGEEDARELHSMDHAVNVDEFMNLELPEGEGKIRYTVYREVEDVKATVLNSRKVNLQVVIHLKVDVNRSNEYAVISQVEGIGQMQVRKSEKKTSVISLDREEKYMVKEEISVPASAPNIHEILWWEASIVRAEPHIMEGTASLRGELLMNVLYRGENAEEPAEYLEESIPFQGILRADSLQEGAPVRFQMQTSGITVRAAADEDGEPRCVSVEAMIECHLQAYSQQSLTVIEDLYAPGWNVEPQWSVSTAKRIVMQESHVQRISENIMIPETYPAALQLFGTSGAPHVDDFYTVDGTLNADGILNLQLFYLSAEERYPIAALQEKIPFTTEIQGIPDEEIMVEMTPMLMKIEAELINAREVKIHAEIRLDLLATMDEEVPIMVNLEANPKPTAELEAQPAIVLYVVQPGEDLWSIAKEYDTTPERIAQVNHLEDAKDLAIGQQLLLVKE